MKLHILGICGTFMAGIAQLARELGHDVTGSDAHTYPPMSTLLADLGVTVRNGYRPAHIPDDVDACIVGNAMTRGNPEVEHVLNNRLDMMSGPEWLHRHVLRHRDVIAIAGTHGKTTTTAMVCHALDRAGEACGFLVGGVPGNFNVSARLGDGRWFVIEADEYDTAFFDKRSKFVHYHPRVAVLNNLEFDHADIFDDIAQIKTQFHHLVRIVPGNGTIVVNRADANLADVLARGCWSHLVSFEASDRRDDTWRVSNAGTDFRRFDIVAPDGRHETIEWPLFGAHNAANALAASAACDAAGLPLREIASSFASFKPPRRRLQHLGEFDGVVVYEDFAHHPTAIATTLDALAARHPDARLVAVVEMRSNTMRTPVHAARLGGILSRPAASIVLRGADMQWDPGALTDDAGSPVCAVFDDAGAIVEHLHSIARPGDVIVLMSNGGFQGLPAALVDAFAARGEPTAGAAVHSSAERIHS